MGGGGQFCLSVTNMMCEVGMSQILSKKNSIHTKWVFVDICKSNNFEDARRDFVLTQCECVLSLTR